MNKLQTLCIICRGSRILLGMKKRGFGAGKWNGFGGKVDPGETIIEAALRELREEADIEAVEMTLMGNLNFTYAGNPDVHEVHIYRVDEFVGEPRETEEMMPQWFDVGDIPFDNMWPDDAYWLPLLLEDKKFTGSFTFDENGGINAQDLTTTENL